MSDWTERLTEEERAAMGYTRTAAANAGATHTVEVLHVCNEALLNLRTVAALRALVGEIRKRCDEVGKPIGYDPTYALAQEILALTEDDMRKRLE